MERKEIEEKVRNFLIEDLEIDEEKIASFRQNLPTATPTLSSRKAKPRQ